MPRLTPSVDVIGRVSGEAPLGMQLEQREQGAAERQRRRLSAGRGGSRQHHRRRRCRRRGQTQQRRVDRPRRRAAGRGQDVGAHLTKERAEKNGRREEQFPL